MDPLGFALENFDALGKWRTSSDGAPIDAVGVACPTARRFDGVAGLRDAPGRPHRDEFVRTLTEKLLTYALGRGVEYRDLPAVRRIARDAAPAGYRWSSTHPRHRQSAPFSMA